MPADAMRELFRTAGPLPNLAPSWNVAPTQSAPVVRRHPETGDRHLDPLRFWPVSKAVNTSRNNGPELLAEHVNTAPDGGGGPNPT